MGDPSDAGNPVRVERNGPVTTVILDRKDVRNAVDRDTANALVEAFLAFDADPDQKVGVFWGAHGTFCAGADLKSISTGAMNRFEAMGTGLAFSRRDGTGPMGPSRTVLQKPVIAAIAGHAVAGGIELALWCDLRVVEEDAVMGVFCRRFGVPLVDGGTVRLPRLIGQSRALDLILTGRPVGAEEALQMGLANRVVPKGEARKAAEDLAREIARFPELCMRNDRLSVYEQWDLPYPDAMANEFRRGWEVIQAGETLTGATRFAQGHGRGGSFSDF